MAERIKNNTDERKLISNILKECYWDYDLTEDDILGIISSDNMRLKQKLFAKIIYNSTDRLRDLRIFMPEDLPRLFNSFSPSYRDTVVGIHVAALRNILLRENNRIEGLAWKKR